MKMKMQLIHKRFCHEKATAEGKKKEKKKKKQKQMK